MFSSPHEVITVFCGMAHQAQIWWSCKHWQTLVAATALFQSILSSKQTFEYKHVQYG